MLFYRWDSNVPVPVPKRRLKFFTTVHYMILFAYEWHRLAHQMSQWNKNMEKVHKVLNKTSCFWIKKIKTLKNCWPIEPGHQTMDLSLVRSVPLRWALTKPEKVLNFKIEDSNSGSYVSHRKKEESKYIRKRHFPWFPIFISVADPRC